MWKRGSWVTHRAKQMGCAQLWAFGSDLQSLGHIHSSDTKFVALRPNLWPWRQIWSQIYVSKANFESLGLQHQCRICCFEARLMMPDTWCWCVFLKPVLHSWGHIFSTKAGWVPLSQTLRPETIFTDFKPSGHGSQLGATDQASGLEIRPQSHKAGIWWTHLASVMCIWLHGYRLVHRVADLVSGRWTWPWEDRSSL